MYIYTGLQGKLYVHAVESQSLRKRLMEAKNARLYQYMKHTFQVHHEARSRLLREPKHVATYGQYNGAGCPRCYAVALLDHRHCSIPSRGSFTAFRSPGRDPYPSRARGSVGYKASWLHSKNRVKQQHKSNPQYPCMCMCMLYDIRHWKLY